jgi:ankyrin repeat protein
MKAISDESEEIVKALMEKGVKPNIADRQEQPLRLAVSRNHSGIVESLIDHGADINYCCDPNNNTALMGAVSEGHQEITTLLLSKGAEPDLKNEAGRTALMNAAMQGRNEMVKLLITHGCDTHAKDNDGISSWEHALRHGHEKHKGGIEVTKYIVNLSPNSHYTTLGPKCLVFYPKLNRLDPIVLFVHIRHFAEEPIQTLNITYMGPERAIFCNYPLGNICACTIRKASGDFV